MKARYVIGLAALAGLAMVRHYPSQGDGARALLAKPKLSASKVIPPLPQVVLPPGRPTLTNYFAVTCTDNLGLTSDYSSEVSVSTNRPITVTLAWNASPSTNTITNYTLWQGPASRAYTNHLDVGTNLTGTMRIPKMLMPVLTVSLTNGPSLSVTNPAFPKLFWRGYAWSAGTKYPTVIQASPSVRGPWTNACSPVTNSTRPALTLNLSRYWL